MYIATQNSYMDGWIYLIFYKMMNSVSEMKPVCLDFEKKEIYVSFSYISTEHRFYTSQLRSPRWRDGWIHLIFYNDDLYLQRMYLSELWKKIGNFKHAFLFCFLYPVTLKLDLWFQTYFAWIHLMLCNIGTSFLVMIWDLLVFKWFWFIWYFTAWLPASQ